MVFNHYAKIKRILDAEPPGWYIKRIDKPTTAHNFKGEIVRFPHYYRIFSASDSAIKYCKFQQIDRFAASMQIPAEELPIVS